MVNNLVSLLPEDGHQKEPSSDVTINICGVLNNLVTSSSVAARDITFFDGLTKLIAIKNSHDSRWAVGEEFIQQAKLVHCLLVVLIQTFACFHVI